MTLLCSLRRTTNCILGPDVEEKISIVITIIIIVVLVIVITIIAGSVLGSRFSLRPCAASQRKTIKKRLAQGHPQATTTIA
eukprot:8850852-Pyramimonas_sp.AAC.1